MAFIRRERDFPELSNSEDEASAMVEKIRKEGAEDGNVLHLASTIDNVLSDRIL